MLVLGYGGLWILLTLCIHKVGYRNHCISSLSFLQVIHFLLSSIVSYCLCILKHPPTPGTKQRNWSPTTSSGADKNIAKISWLSSFHSNIVGSFRKDRQSMSMCLLCTLRHHLQSLCLRIRHKLARSSPRTEKKKGQIGAGHRWAPHYVGFDLRWSHAGIGRHQSFFHVNARFWTSIFTRARWYNRSATGLIQTPHFCGWVWPQDDKWMSENWVTLNPLVNHDVPYHPYHPIAIWESMSFFVKCPMARDCHASFAYCTG